MVKANSPDIIMTRPKLAKRLGIHPNTLIYWERQGMPVMRGIRAVRYDLSEVKKWLSSRSRFAELESKGDGE